jgi:AraC-like DNA-binding protein
MRMLTGEARLSDRLTHGLVNRLFTAPPASHLRSIVASWSYREVEIDGVVHVPLLARPLQFVEWYLDEPFGLIDWETGARTKPPGYVVAVGAQTRRQLDLELGGTFRVFTMQLLPTAVHRLTGFAMHELTNGAVDAVSLFGPDTTVVLDRLRYARSFAECIAIGESFVTRRLAGARSWNSIDAVATQIRLHGAADLSVALRNSGLGARQFERRFLHAVGMPAATYLRVGRFHHALERKEREPHLRWADVAAEFGYYDQSHLARDAKALGGDAASRLLEQAAAVDETVIAMSQFS